MTDKPQESDSPETDAQVRECKYWNATDAFSAMSSHARGLERRLRAAEERAESYQMKCLLYRAYSSPEPEHRQQAFRDAMLNADLAEARIKELEERLADLRRPTHGPCCTCQRCGKDYDTCRCDLDEVCDALEAERARVSELEERLEIGFAFDGDGKRIELAGGPDGIACRDETIRLLEERLAKSQDEFNIVYERAHMLEHNVSSERAARQEAEQALRKLAKSVLRYFGDDDRPIAVVDEAKDAIAALERASAITQRSAVDQQEEQPKS